MLNGEEETKIITVKNGGKKGEWTQTEHCPQGTKARGFSLKVESQAFLSDDTALNGIILHCTRDGMDEDSVVSSGQGRWGANTGTNWCTDGYLVAFSLRVETSSYTFDETAANNIRFKCNNGKYLEGKGMSWGNYSQWSPECEEGICGIQTKIEKEQGMFGDDTALNDVRFYCC
ncbi:hypothetical protein GDO86_019591 [Hymenochirus boettgeri]|uniref:Vitelline membrane outer layer 1-like protein n=1 Tax=Hymenochirus boettgeri TaxID=247094 RepID=A0A8T2IDC4_9PIPI|nr:hypothetical protein GDO86_019591 [Hymenochirus boettgeri]